MDHAGRSFEFGPGSEVMGACFCGLRVLRVSVVNIDLDFTTETQRSLRLRKVTHYSKSTSLFFQRSSLSRSQEWSGSRSMSSHDQWNQAGVDSRCPSPCGQRRPFLGPC